MSFHFINEEKFLLDGKSCSYIKTLPDGQVQIEYDDTGFIEHFSQSEMIKFYADKKLTLLSKRSHIHENTVLPISTLLELGYEARFAMNLKLACVKAILSLRAMPTDDEIEDAGNKVFQDALNKYPQLVKDLFEGFQDKKSHYTFKRWVKRYLDSGRDATSLLSHKRFKGNRKPRINCSSEFNDILNSVIEIARRDSKSYKIKEIHDMVDLEIIKANQNLDSDKKISRVSYSTTRRIINDLAAYEYMLVNRSQEETRVMFRTIISTNLREVALEHVEIDHTVLDYIITDQSGRAIGRPYLTAAICKNTKVLVGFYLGLEPPSYLSVKMCLKHVITPKLFMDCNGNDMWPMFGVPQFVVLDNGPEFHSESFRYLLAVLGIDPVYCPRKSGWLKGAIERYFRTLNDGLIHRIPGTTLSNPRQRGNYDSEKNAVLTLEQARYIIQYWICNIYHNTVHGTLRTTPLKRWEERLKIDKIKLIPNIGDVEPLLGELVRNKSLSVVGIRHACLDYRSNQLCALHREIGDAKVDIRFNKLDLGKIYIIHPKTGETIVANCTRYEYANGLSQYLHDNIRKNLTKPLDKMEEEALVEARLHISNYLDECIQDNKAKKSVRKKAARILQQNIEQNGKIKKSKSFDKELEKSEDGIVDSPNLNDEFSSYVSYEHDVSLEDDSEYIDIGDV